MFKLGTENSWFCNSGFDQNIDFCFWVLEVDGLRVPPFSTHPEGDGSLRRAGLDASSWLTWSQEVVRLQDQGNYTRQKESLRIANETWEAFGKDLGKPNANDPQSLQRMQAFNQQVVEAQKARGVLFPEFIKPVEVWHGSADVQACLSELWEQYSSVAQARGAWEASMARRWHAARGNTNVPAPNLWHELKPYHDRLPSLFIHFVPYVVEIDYMVAPASVVMTVVRGELEQEAFHQRAIQAAEVLCQEKA